MSVPQLRFKGFRGDWSTRKISEVLQRVSRPVDVEPDQKYRQIGIRSHGKGIFHKEPVTGASLGKKRIFWVDENLFFLITNKEQPIFQRLAQGGVKAEKVGLNES